MTTEQAELAALPLSGFTVAVTAARRGQDLETLLVRYGARVRTAAAIAMAPLADDAELRAVSDELIANPPDMFIATTALGFRGWVSAAREWGIGDELVAALGRGRVISRGPKATGAMRAEGLREEWSPATEASAELLTHLRAEGIAGLRVAVQLHGAVERWDPYPEFLPGLRAAGAVVIPAPVYRWTLPVDLGALDRLIREIVAGEVDAVTFTSAPAVVSLLDRADALGVGAGLRDVLRSDVVVYSVGPVTSTPLDRAGIPSRMPERMRLGSLGKFVVDDLPRVLRDRSARRPE